MSAAEDRLTVTSEAVAHATRTLHLYRRAALIANIIGLVLILAAVTTFGIVNVIRQDNARAARSAQNAEIIKIGRENRALLQFDTTSGKQERLILGCLENHEDIIVAVATHATPPPLKPGCGSL